MMRRRRLWCEQLETRSPLTLGSTHLVFVTHGWNGQAEGWPTEMRTNIARQVEMHRTAEVLQVHQLAWSEQQSRLDHATMADNVDELWEIVAFDWEEGASGLFPNSAAESAAEIGGRLGAQLATREYATVHLIAHSAGSWMIDAMVDVMESRNREIFTHATFLDAFTPGTDLVSRFGRSADSAEHYLHDGVLPATNDRLQNAWNIDLTLLGPSSLADIVGFGIPGHAWPWEWYLQTTVNPFASDSHGSGFVRSPAMQNNVEDDSQRGATIALGQIGDSNDDGQFDSSDLIQVFQFGGYNSAKEATWQQGDWNKDGVFDSDDLITAFQSGLFVGA